MQRHGCFHLPKVIYFVSMTHGSNRNFRISEFDKHYLETRLIQIRNDIWIKLFYGWHKWQVHSKYFWFDLENQFFSIFCLSHTVWLIKFLQKHTCIPWIMIPGTMGYFETIIINLSTTQENLWTMTYFILQTFYQVWIFDTQYHKYTSMAFIEKVDLFWLLFVLLP